MNSSLENNSKKKIALLFSGSPATKLKHIQNQFSTITRDQIYDIFAVDKGLEICHKMNLPVHKIIGDMDSVDHHILNDFSSDIIMQFPKRKDLSDTDLAIEYLLNKNYQKIYIFSAIGGRIDHQLFIVLSLLKSPGNIILLTDQGLLWALSPKIAHQISMEKNQTFSLIPLSRCKDVDLNGCEYPLHNEDLLLDSRTLSNVAKGSIQIDKGKLLFYKHVEKRQ